MAADAVPKPLVQTDLRFEKSAASSRGSEAPAESPVECKRIEGFLSEYRNTTTSRLDYDDEMDEVGPHM